MFKDFDAMLAEKSTGRPMFTVGGQKFTARAKLPWKKFSALILSLVGDDVSTSGGIEKTESFFRMVLVREDRERFMALINNDGDEDEDDDKVVGTQQISDLLDWMLEYYTGKATMSDTPSPPTPLDSGVSVNTVSLTPKTDSL